MIFLLNSFLLQGVQGDQCTFSYVFRGILLTKMTGLESDTEMMDAPEP